MPRVDAKPHENFERLFGRFKRSVEKSGILKDAHTREFFERQGETRKKAKAAAIARYKRKLALEQTERDEQRLAHRTPGQSDKYRKARYEQQSD